MRYRQERFIGNTMTNFKATAIYAVYNVGVNTEERIFDTFEEAGDWLELRAIESGDYEAFWANGSTIEELEEV